LQLRIYSLSSHSSIFLVVTISKLAQKYTGISYNIKQKQLDTYKKQLVTIPHLYSVAVLIHIFILLLFQLLDIVNS